ncbi:MAG: PaaI family thioesterase [Hyphomonadaceae bacterium]
MASLKAEMIPMAKLIGVEVLETSAEGVAGRLFARPDLCNSDGALHGGAIMTFADTLGAMAALMSLPPEAKSTTTLESKTNFLRGVAAGQTVLGRATPVHRGRRTSVWQTRIETEEGKLVALVTQTQMTV